MIGDYVFRTIFMNKKNDKVFGRELKLILCIGLEFIRKISLNLLSMSFSIAEGNFPSGNLSDFCK